MSKTRCLPKNNFQPSQGVQKNVLRVNFTENKFRHRSLDNNLQKISKTDFLEKAIGKILLMVVLMVSLYLDGNRWTELIKMIPPSLGIWKISPFA